MNGFLRWLSLLIAILIFIVIPAPLAHAAPPRPTGLFVDLTDSSEIRLNWTDVGASYYKVYFGSAASGMSLYGTDSTTICTLKGLNCNTRYFLKVRAYTSSGSASPFSTTISASTLPGIAAPASLSAAAVDSTRIRLDWPSVYGAGAYMVYSKESASDRYQALSAVTTTFFVDTGIPGNTRRYYRVRAVNYEGEGYFSPSANARTCPSPVTNLHASALGNGRIRLTWHASSGATRYRVYREDPGMLFNFIAETNHRYYQDRIVSHSTLYRYTVSAVSTAGEGNPSVDVSVRTAPGVPAGLHAQALSISKIKLTWSWADGADYYAVYRSKSLHGAYARIQFTTDVSFTCEGLPEGKRYYFKVAALNSGGVESDKSAAVSCKTYTAPNPKKPRFKLNGMGPSPIFPDDYMVNFDHTLSTAYPTTAEPLFKLYQGSTRAGMLADIPDVRNAVDVMGSDSFTEFVRRGQTVWFGFRASMGNHSSPMQILQFAALLPPSSLSTTYLGGGTVRLSWSPVEYASQYRIYVSEWEPDTLNAWADNKAALLAAHKLRYKGSVTGNVTDIADIPNHATRYYIVVPADAAVIESWYFGYRQFRYDA